MKNLLHAALGFLVLTAFHPAQAPAAPAPAEVKTEKVIVFKDGYCLVVKRVSGMTDVEGKMALDQVPESAVLGSFWAVPERGRLLSMTAEEVTDTAISKETRLGTRHLDLLEANRGRKCRVVLRDGSSMEAVILEVLAGEREVQAMPATPAMVTTRSTSDGSLFVLRTEEGDVVLPISDIKRLIIPEMKLDATTEIQTTTTTKRLTFRFAETGVRRDLVMFYFTPGLRWIPTYRIELEDDAGEGGEARLSLQAEIVNEIEDLENVDVSLVVGVPNFRFRKLVSPLSLEATLRDALAQAAPQLSGRAGQMSNVLFTQRASEWRAPDPVQPTGRNAAPAMPEELAAGEAHDLFVYEIGRLSLARGARSAVPISTSVVPYRDVYTWDLSLKRSNVETAPSGAGIESPLELSEARVWHQVELTNVTGHPWTTGAAMLMQGLQPLAQELLTYTSPGGKVRIPVTVAVDLRGTFSEKETGRTPNALQWRSHSYTRIDRSGLLDLSNRKRVPVQVEITCNLGGRATGASDGGEIVLNAYQAVDWISHHGDPAVNNHSTITWKAVVKPGESFRPTVDYHYYVLQ